MVMLVQTGKRTVNHHQLVVRKKSASSKSRSEGWEYRAAISLTRNITMHGEQEKHRARTYLLSMARVFRNYKTGSIFFQALQQLPCPWRIPSVAFGSCLLRSTDSTVQPTLMNGIPLEYLSLFEMTDLHQSHLFNDMLWAMMRSPIYHTIRLGNVFILGDGLILTSTDIARWWVQQTQVPTCPLAAS